MTKTILITGGSGFIGRNLVEKLEKKYRILVPSHKELDLAHEVAVSKYLKGHKIHTVIHAANIGGARNVKDTPDTFIINLKMFLNLLKCRKQYRKMILLGSGAEYDKKRDLATVKETDFGKYVPADNYGLGKYICSLYIENIDNIVSLRLFGIYGKYEDYRIRFISNIVRQLLTKKTVTINQNAYFDYLYVDDLVKIINHFITHKPRYKFYNVGSGKRVALIPLAKKIMTIAGKRLPIVVVKPGLNYEYTPDITLLKKEIPNFKLTDFDKSIKELIGYYTHTI